MPQIKAYDAGNLKLQPTEVGVESTAAAGRRMGAFYNQLGAGQQELGRDLGQLGRETGQLGSERGRFAQQVGQETSRLGSEVGQFSRELGRETAALGGAKARALNSWGEGIGKGIAAGGEAAINYQTHKDVSVGSRAFADFGLAKGREWNQTVQNADPNDPSIASNFMAGLETDLQKLKNGFNTDKGQEWAEAHIAHLRDTFSRTTQADMSSLAKKAFADNYRGTMNSLSAAVYDNPAILPEKIAELESSATALVGSSPNLKGVDAVNLHGQAMQQGVESLVKSAALGHISKTGQVPDWLSDPQYSKYVNAAEMQTFSRTAQAQQRTNVAQEKATAAYTRQQANDRATADVTKAWNDNVQVDDVTGQPTIKPDYFKNVMDAVKNNPNSPNAAQLGRTYLNWGESQLKRQNAITNPELKSQFMDRIANPENPLKVSDLMQAQIDGKLSQKDFAQMKGLVTQLDKETFKDQNYKNAMDAAKSQLGTDPKGRGRYADFAAEFMPQYAAAKRAGTLQPNALDTQDPKSMISQTMGSYKRPYEQYITDKITHGMSVGGAQTARPANAEPEIGEIREGWRFRGGDWRSKSNWDLVGGGPAVPQSR